MASKKALKRLHQNTVDILMDVIKGYENKVTFQRSVMDSLTATIEALDAQIDRLRDENSTLQEKVDGTNEYFSKMGWSEG